MFPRFSFALRAAFAAAVATLVLASLYGSSVAAPTVGFVEKWPSGISSWGGGSGIVFSNPLNGGVDDDGFLQMSLGASGHFGTRSNGPEYVGNWKAAGIDRIKVSLNDLASNNSLNMHVSIGRQTNLWQYNIGFVPAVETWTEYVVDLSDSTLFTRVVGAGSFTDALQNVEVLHIRHDLPPFSQTPDFTAGDLGIDNLTLASSTVGVGDVPRAGIAPVELAAPSPNPSRGPVALAMRVSDDSPIDIRILDLQGRQVRHQQLAGAAGLRVWTWDGRDQQGRIAPAGIYRAIASSKAGGTSRSLVRIR